MAAEGADERIKEVRGFTHPGGEGRAIKIQARASINTHLAVERTMVGVLTHQHLRQKCRRRQSAINRSQRRALLHDL